MRWYIIVDPACYLQDGTDESEPVLLSPADIIQVYTANPPETLDQLTEPMDAAADFTRLYDSLS